MRNSTSKLSTITNSDQTEEYESDSDESTFDDELENQLNISLKFTRSLMSLIYEAVRTVSTYNTYLNT